MPRKPKALDSRIAAAEEAGHAANANVAAIKAKTGSKPTRGPGRPKELLEDMAQVTFRLYRRQLNTVDRLGLDIRDNTGKTLDRSPLLRGILDGVLDGGVDLSQCASEGEVRPAVSAATKGK